MAIKTILKIGNPKLRNISTPIEFDKDNYSQIISDLRDTLHSFQEKEKIGRAIAAIQINYNKRIIYMESNQAQYTLINPVIISKSDEMFYLWDSCFSANVEFFGNTLRNRSIIVEYFDEKENK